MKDQFQLHICLPCQKNDGVVGCYPNLMNSADGDEFGVEAQHEGAVVESKDDCSSFTNLKGSAVVDQPG